MPPPTQSTDSRPVVRIRFVGFWDDFNTEDNFFTQILQRRYRVEISDTPDYIIYSCIGSRRKDFLKYDCVRIFYTGENVPPTGSPATGPSRSNTPLIRATSGCRCGPSTPIPTGL